MSGITSYHAGRVAEDQVQQQYQSKGHTSLANRWRGSGGELDLVMRGPDGLVFVEVKKSKSHALAAQRVSARQIQRIFNTAQEFLAANGLSQSTNMRFDVALLNQHGEISVLENALAA